MQGGPSISDHESSDVARARTERAVRSVLRHVGTLLLVPLAVFLLGSEWSCQRQYQPSSARLNVDSSTNAPGSAALEAARAGQTVDLGLAREGARATRGVLIEPGSSLWIELPKIRRDFELTLQAAAGDRVAIDSVSPDGSLRQIWQVPDIRGSGLRQRSAQLQADGDPMVLLRLAGVEGPVRISGLRLDYRTWVFDHRLLIPALWALWLGLQVARRLDLSKKTSERLLGAWSRADAWMAAGLVLAVAFRIDGDTAALALLLLVLGAIARWIARVLVRSPIAGSIYLVFLVGLFFYFLPWAVGRVIVHRVSALHDFSVDHRLRPDGDEINPDGIRFRGTAATLASRDFVILVLGDSFTYGLRLDYEQSYPYVLEQVLASAECREPVRVVNMGWTSSSPLLALRLLRQIGEKYQPDLVLYTLDMTDFHDDLRYERELTRAGDLEIPQNEITRALAKRAVAKLPPLSEWLERLAGLRRANDVEPSSDEKPLPADRFFITAQSLDESRAAIERGTMRYLGEIDQHASELGARTALVLYPRAYQYSADESPRNWEGHRYQKLGPFVREPFRYFEEASDTLPYPVLNLLPAFEQSEQFPLFLEDDPHWNSDGAQLAASALAELLVDAELVPCQL